MTFASPFGRPAGSRSEAKAVLLRALRARLKPAIVVRDGPGAARDAHGDVRASSSSA